MAHRSRAAGIAAMLALVLGACGSDPAPTALVPTTVETLPSSTVAETVPAGFRTPTDFALPAPIGDTAGAAGSGCGLGTTVGDELHDGVWLVRIVGGGGAEAVVDLACGYQDPNDPGCTQPPFVDWCVRDSTQRERTVRVDPNPTVRVPNGDGTALVPGALASIGDAYVWIAINGGVVTELTRQRT